jgi:hypothetical protein
VTREEDKWRGGYRVVEEEGPGAFRMMVVSRIAVFGAS